jgi:hypothetical protein
MLDSPPREVFKLALSSYICRLTIKMSTQIRPAERTFVFAGWAWLRACRVADMAAKRSARRASMERRKFRRHGFPA